MRAVQKKAVVLVSGGLDSATVLAIAKSEGFSCYALSFDYGQRHRIELEAARRVTAAAGVTDHLVIHADLTAIGGSALTSDDIDVPKSRNISEMASSIPVTYVPARNTIFLSYALALAETIGCADIFIGANAVDFSGYPDCRPEFFRAFEKTANLGTRAGAEKKTRLKIHTPIISMSKAEIIVTGTRLGVDYGLTHSCYDPDPRGLACGRCDSCLLRKKGFEEANIPDPTRYANRP